jgi:hypothetical protein
MRVRRLREEEGSVLVTVALWLPALILFIVLVVDVGNWFVHKRHLQMQADAGAFAGGGVFTIPCSDTPVVAEARKYAGDPAAAGPYNLQVPPTDQANVHMLVNSKLYWNEGGTDYSDGGPPCAARMVDVKMTEASLPWFFGLKTVPAINAHARVVIQALESAAGALPVAVPDPSPTSGRVYFVNETTGATIASAPLTKNPTQVNGLTIWENVSAPVDVGINSSAIGVRVALGGGSSTTCGDPLVSCYDVTSSTRGILYIRGWSTSGSGAQPNPPIARDVTLSANTCSDGYFFSSAATCSVGVRASIDVGSLATSKVQITAFGGMCPNSGCPLAYNATSGRWEGSVSIPAGSGAAPIELRWQEITGSVTGKGTCSATFKNNNPCQDTFGTVQRSFSAGDAYSGPIKLAEVWEGGAFNADSFQLGTTHSLSVRIGIAGSLRNATGVNDPVVQLRVSGGSENQSIDCDPNLSNLRDEIQYGCSPDYEVNTGTACPSTASVLWGTPQPWNCVAIQTGGAVGQVQQGMQARILGGASTCTAPNNWASFPNIPPDDRRIVPVFLTPFGTFSGSGNAVYPVIGFGAFYVTGWFGDPCAGDDPVPDKGYIVGHFIKYIFHLNNGGGSGQLCDLGAFGSCIAVLTE